MADQWLTWNKTLGILAMAVFSGAADQRCLCFSGPPPAALLGMLHTLTGDGGGGGADSIPRSFLRDPTCTLLPTAVGVPTTNQEAAPNFPLRQQQIAGLCFSLTAWKQMSSNCDGGHLAFRAKVSLGK